MQKQKQQSVAVFPKSSPYALKKGAQRPRRENGTNGETVLTLGNISAWIGVTVAASSLFYVLGVVFLTVQIHATYNLSFPTAWYAASLVSSIGVLGVSLGIIKGMWFILLAETILGVFFVRLTLPTLGTSRSFADWGKNYVSAYRHFGLTRIGIVWITVNILLVVFTITSVIAQFNIHHNIGSAVIYTLGSGWYIFLDLTLIGKKSLRVRVLIVFVFIYSSVGLSAIYTPGIEAPQLPAIEINMDAPPKIDGQLLKHGDSYWYVLTKNPGRVMAVPDSAAQIVTIHTNGNVTPTPTKAPMP